MSKEFGIHWFRRDLRVAGNPALSKNFELHQGRVVGFFCFDRNFLNRPDFSANRFQFFLHTLKELQVELRRLGGDLLVLDKPPLEAFKHLFMELEKAKVKPSLISFNRDYEPFAKDRDLTMQTFFTREKDVRVYTENDHLLIEPKEIIKDDGEVASYQVYTPFKRRWFEALARPRVQARIELQRRGLAYLDLLSLNKEKKLFRLTWSELFSKNTFRDSLAGYIENNRAKVSIAMPKVGSLAALAHLREFKKKISSYAEGRDVPSLSGTSQMSIYLKNGSITTGQIMAELGLESIALKDQSGAAKYLSELIWREFYYHILDQHPDVESEVFLKKYKSLAWQNDEKLFDAWKNGLTGFPIVDAGMRQLKATGWMHNRVRMIVASFLTKDLLIDYRWGEAHFMHLLLDGDLAPNNGGWQWAASTGCDPQPYFRIFNPTLQGEKFDPDGFFVKKYVPELAALSKKDVHQPWKNPQACPNYPTPVVDHKTQRDLALKMYVECRKT